MTSRQRITLLAVLAVPGAAWADAKQDAEEHIANATRAHEAGKFDEALAELTAAYKLDPRPELAYAIGQVDVKLGKCDDARAAYVKFLASSTDAQAKSLVEQALASCVPAKIEAPPPPKKEPPATTVTRTKKPFYKDVLGDGLVVAGLASAAIGFVVYSGAVSTNDGASGQPNLGTYNDELADARSKRTMSVVLIGGGAALVTAGILSYVMRDRTEVRRVAVAAGPDGGLVSWNGRF